MMINIKAFNEDYAIKNKLNINQVATIGYLKYLSKTRGNEFKYSYTDLFNELPIIFNCRTRNANYKKINKILVGTDKFVDRIYKRNGSKGIEIVFKLKDSEVNKLELENMFIGE